MLSLLSGRETGILGPEVIQRSENNRRSLALDVSHHVSLQKIHTGAVNSLDLDSVENRYLLSGSSDGLVSIHDLHVSSGKPEIEYPTVGSINRCNKHRHKFSVETVQWYPYDTGLFMTSGMDKLLKVWDANVLKPAEQYEFSGAVYDHHVSPIATRHCLIAVATQSSKLKLVDIKSGSTTHTLFGHKQSVYCVKWSSMDENILASGSGDNRVMLWDVRQAKGHLMVLDQHNGLTSSGPKSVNTAHNGRVNGMCFTPDGQHLLTFGTDDKLRLWNTATGRNTNMNYGRLLNNAVKCVMMSLSTDCSAQMVFVPTENNIKVLDIFSGGNLRTLRGHYNQVNCCLFHPDYQELYSGANDRNMLVWVPHTAAVAAYDAALRENSRKKDSERVPGFSQRVGVNNDNWSSDEEA